MSQKTLNQIIELFNDEDSLAIPLATGQPLSLMNALSQKKDWKKLSISCGLMSFPYSILTHPNVFVTSGYYGPIERFLNSQNHHMEYLPASFSGFEYFALKNPTRIIATTLSLPDDDGYCTFGTHGAAIYNPFIEALKNKNQIAIAEINPTMPRIYGHKDYGDNKVHINDLNFYFESQNAQIEMPNIPADDVSKKIAEHILSLIDNKATLQFGIGAVPEIIADHLSQNKKSDFGIHSELISDGFLKMYEKGKISNKNKNIFKNQSVFTFAFGKKSLYDFLDERNFKNKRQAVCLPVSIVNDPYFISQNENFISINSGLTIDFQGQVCSEAIGLKQYSGVGGQLSFVQGAYQAKKGKTIICIKSTALVNGKMVSNILPTLPTGSIVSTPRHFVQYVVTEYGIANLYGVSDEKRGLELIKIAHPDFRDDLSKQFEEIRNIFYKN